MKKRKIDKRKLQIGAYSTLITIGAIIVVLLINIAVTALDKAYGLNIDLTEEKMYSLSDESKKILKNVKDDTIIYYMDTPYNMDERIKNFLLEYTVVNPKITVETIDPATEPNFVKKFDTDGSGVATGSIIVSTAEDTKFKVMSITNDLTEYDSDNSVTYFLGEQVVTSAIKHLTDAATYRVYFVTGHNEADLSNTSIAKMEKRLKQDNYIVDSINLSQDGDKLKAQDVLVMLGATTDISTKERETLKNFLENEGRLYITTRPSTTRLENLYSLMEFFDLKIDQNLLYETQRASYYGSPNIPLVSGTNDEDTISYKLSYDAENKSAVAIMANCNSVGYTQKNKDGWNFEELLRLSPYSFAKSNINSKVTTKEVGDTDAGSNGILCAVYVSVSDYAGATKENTRIMLVGSTDFIAVEDYRQLRFNNNFFTNGIHLLAGKNEDIGVKALEMTDTTLTLSNSTQTQLIIIIVIILLPLIILVSGLIVWRRRRYL